MDKQKRRRVFSIIIAIVIIIVLILSLRCCQSGTPDNNGSGSETTETEKKTLDFTPAEERRIKIPAVTGINLKAGQLRQTVDFHNPKENDCYFVLSLYLSDDTLIYQSDMLAPSEQISEIELLQELQRGIYRNCRLVYSCFALDGKTKLNGSNVVLEINSY